MRSERGKDKERKKKKGKKANNVDAIVTSL